MTKRKRIPRQIQTELLMRSGRRCCLCYGLQGDGNLKDGQIAHIDRDPGNAEFDNLAYLCLDHHNQYDSRPGQTKRLTPDELKRYRDQLFEAVARLREEQGLESVERESDWDRATPERLEEALPPLEGQKPEEQRRQERELQNKLDSAIVFALEDEATIASRIKRAEQFVAEGEHGQAADILANLASVLAQNKQPVQARVFAKRAATEYVAARDNQAAAEQLILGAEIWLTQTTYEPRLARRELEQAIELSKEAHNYTLWARAILLQAYHYLTDGDPDRSKTLWEKADSLLIKVSHDSQVELYCELALQRAMHARVAEDYTNVLWILTEADKRDWSPKSRSKRLELLWVLLFVEAETGDWGAVDRTYRKAKEVLNGDHDPLQEGAWLMHYAGTLARRGAENDAYEAYMEAMDRLQKVGANVYHKYHLYQDMTHMLLRYVGFKISAPVLSYDSRRLDLALNVLHEDQSHRHIQRARQSYIEGDLENATQHGQTALILSWRAGSWSGVADAYRTLALLHAADEEPAEAALSAIRAGDDKMVREYANKAAKTIDKEGAEHLADNLLAARPSIPEQRSALIALTNCVDIISPAMLDSTIDQALDVLKKVGQGAEPTLAQHAAQLLGSIAARLDSLQTNQILRISLDQLPKASSPLVRSELVRLVGTYFGNECVIGDELSELALKALLPLADSEYLHGDVESALFLLGKNSPVSVSDKVVAYFRQNRDWIYVAGLGKLVPEKQIRETIERVFEAITPHWEKGSISYGGWRAQTITNFNEILPRSLHSFVVNGLLDAATNLDGLASQRAGAILTLRWLAKEVIRPRADRIAATLLEVLEENEADSQSLSTNLFGGSPAQIAQSALYTLGYLYKWVSDERRQSVLECVLSSSYQQDRLVRTGAVMALRQIKGFEELPIELTMTLERLLTDSEPSVRHWAGAALGHLVIQPFLQESLAAYFSKRLSALALSEENAFARSGMAYGLRVIATERRATSVSGSVLGALEQLAEDISFQVRRQAKLEEEEE